MYRGYNWYKYKNDIYTGVLYIIKERNYIMH